MADETPTRNRVYFVSSNEQGETCDMEDLGGAGPEAMDAIFAKVMATRLRFSFAFVVRNPPDGASGLIGDNPSQGA